MTDPLSKMISTVPSSPALGGLLHGEELAAWVRGVLLPADATDRRIDALFSIADKDGSGALDVGELLWLLDHAQGSRENHAVMGAMAVETLERKRST